MTRRMQENVVILVLIGVFASMIVVGMGYVPRARLVPVPVAAIGLGLALIQFIWQNFRSADDLHVDVLQLIAGSSENAPTTAASDAAPVAKSKGSKPARFTDELKAFAMVSSVVTSFYVFGPLPTTFVFCGLYLSLSRQSSWPRAVLIAGIAAVAIWFLFGEVLGIRIDRSLIGPMLHPFG